MNSESGTNADTPTEDSPPETRDEELVWYAGYGSNLLAERFAAYMIGLPPPNSPGGIAESGARDSRLPRAEWTGEINFEIVFAGAADKWGGGAVAFVDPTPGSGKAYVRAFLVTVEQLEDLHRQENRSTEVRPVDLDQLVAEGSVTLQDGWYSDLLVGATHEDGRPIVVVAGPEQPELGAPHKSYLTTMASGLSTDFGLSHDEICDYLSSRRGAAGQLSSNDVSSLISG